MKTCFGEGILFNLKKRTVEGLYGGFEYVQEGHVTAIVRLENGGKTAAALMRDSGCESVAATGRGVLSRFSWSEGRYGVKRRCKRGGMMRFLLRDHYLFVNRPLKEFTIHLRVQERGLPVPGLLGVCWCRRGPFYSGALATEELPGVDLDAWLRANQGDATTVTSMMLACGALLRTMHDRGVLHGDLQVKNVFISASRVYLLDFDRARIQKDIGKWRRERNLLRLRRSFDKRGHGRAAFAWLVRGYGLSGFSPWLNGLYTIKGIFSDIMTIRRRV